MKRSILLGVIATLALSLSAYASNLTGKIAAGSGTSVVYAEPVGKAAPAAPGHFVIDQKGMQFAPSTLVVPVGSEVEFKNDDMVPHNVFWPSISGNKSLGHNLGTFPQGQSRTYKFDHAGVVQLFCSIHPNMVGTIVVTPTQYYAVSEPILGMFSIANLPDGQYKVTAWHAGSKPQTKIVAVKGNTTVDFKLAQ